MFIKKEEPEDIPEYKLEKSEKLINIMTSNQMVSSNGEARRMIKQGAVRINKDKVDDIHMIVEPKFDIVIKVGKRKFLKVKK